MHDQIVGAVLSATEQAVKLHNIHQLYSLSNFKDNLMPLDHHHLHDIHLCHCNCMSASLHVHFIKPTFIIKTAIKSCAQSQACKDTHDGFTILINILSEILPHVGDYGAVIDPNIEFEKSHVTKSTIFSMLASKRTIV